MKKKILLTGAKGTIGSVLARELASKYELVIYDLPEHDATNYEQLVGMMRGCDAVVHTAHVIGENWDTGTVDPRNGEMEMNILHAAVETGVQRCIMSSSVHADDFLNHTGEQLLTVPGSYRPTSPYGARKLSLEQVSQFYTTHYGLETVCIRYGGVSDDNTVDQSGREPQVWLSHNDLVNAVRCSLDAQYIPDNHTAFYAVSNNAGKLHDTSNAVGWTPRDGDGNVSY